ncbi:MAG TPA: DUF3443 family protein [Polyangia bacterium]|jgi:Protein of unknown function (DUF3443).|nr:DUF3443 family protein [Polyangia bacterium]
MRKLFAISGLLVTALTAACGASSHPTNNPALDSGGIFDGAAKGDVAAGAGHDTARPPDSAGAGVDTGTADLSGTGSGGTGGRTVVGMGGSGGAGSDALAATSGAQGSDAPTATGGTSPTDGPIATGGTGGGGIAGTTRIAGNTSTAGNTNAAGTSGSAGRTATAGTSGSAGTSGGGGSTGIAGAADNVAQVSVDFGLPTIGYLNGLFATITVCVPGTSQCQTVDHVLVDTGSTGLRVLKSALTLSLPAQTNDSGVALAQCGQFVSGFTWGPLRSADLKIAGEQATGLAMQVIEESTYPVPSGCTGTDNSTADTLRANGIIGIGTFMQDCGSACAATPGTRSSNPGLYYACTSARRGGCVVAAVPTAKQLINPVALFSQDNNGTIIELPTISASGAPSVAGALVFGIGTRDNNGLGQATVLQLDDYGEFLTTYPTSGNSSSAFADSGSNALYFANAGSTRIPTCSKYPGFYCPRSTLSLSATIHDAPGVVAVTVNFSIANAETLFATQNNVAFYNLGGTTTMAGTFDWGLPFYFGRNVYASIEGQPTPAGTGPFIAF